MSATILTRRTLIRSAVFGATAIALPEWLNAQALGQGRPMRSAYNTDTGKKMLELFKNAIVEMRYNEKKLPRYHPHNWYFQANIHSYPPTDSAVFNPDKAANEEERARIRRYKEIALGNGTTKGVWRTCSHYGYPTHFLTWHRLYLYFFERIVEKYAGEPFALPYWPYNPRDPNSRRLPPIFLDKTINGKTNPLYFSARNKTFVDNGILTAEEVDASVAIEKSRLLQNSQDDGFSLLLEYTPHGAVHSAVGTVKGMGAFEYAGRDPIFWLHHANIDRIWESWRRSSADGSSPLDTVENADTSAKDNWKKFDKFTFVDASGTTVVATVADAIKASSKLGTSYDKLDPVPGAPGEPAALAFAQSDPPMTLSAKKDEPQSTKITKENAPVKISVAPVVERPVALGFGAKPATRYDLSIDVEAHGQPGAAYQVYIKIAKAPGGVEKIDRLIKTFNLFTHAGHGGDHVTANWRADITSLVRENLIDPTAAVEMTIRARYADPAVPVEVKSVQIKAR